MFRDPVAAHSAQVMGVVHLHVRTWRYDPLSVSRNGLMDDCSEIWYAARNPLARRFTEVDDGIQLHVRTPFPYLRNGWRDCAEIWWCGYGTNSNAFYRYYEWSILRMRTCASLYPISVTAGPFALKFVLLDTY